MLLFCLGLMYNLPTIQSASDLLSSDQNTLDGTQSRNSTSQDEIVGIEEGNQGPPAVQLADAQVMGDSASFALSASLISLQLILIYTCVEVYFLFSLKSQSFAQLVILCYECSTCQKWILVILFYLLPLEISLS